MKQPLLFYPSGQFDPVWSGFHDAVLRPSLSIIRDGSGYRPATPSDYGSLLYASGITITGVFNVEQKHQIASSGNVETSNVAVVDSLGRLYTLASQNGFWEVGITGQPIQTTTKQGGSWVVGISGGQQVGITGQPIQTTTLQGGSWVVGISGGQQVGISGGSIFQLVGSGDINIAPRAIVDESGNLSVVVANFPETSGGVGVTGTVSIDNLPTIIGTTGTVSVNNFPTVMGVTGTLEFATFPYQFGISGETKGAINTGDDVIVTGVGVAMQCPSLAASKGVMVVADLQNSGYVYVGGSNVTNSSGSKRGIILSPGGMPSQLLPVNNANLLWVNADIAGDRVGLIAI